VCWQITCVHGQIGAKTGLWTMDWTLDSTKSPASLISSEGSTIEWLPRALPKLLS